MALTKEEKAAWAKLCIVCDNQCGWEWVATQSAEELEKLIEFWKICKKHTKEMQDLMVAQNPPDEPIF